MNASGSPPARRSSTRTGDSPATSLRRYQPCKGYDRLTRFGKALHGGKCCGASQAAPRRDDDGNDRFFLSPLTVSGTICHARTRKMSENKAAITAAPVDGHILVPTTNTSAARPSASGTVDAVTNQLPTVRN